MSLSNPPPQDTSPPQSDLQRDALVLLRHLPFIALTLVVALLAAVGTGIAAGKTYQATTLVKVQAHPSAVGVPSAIELARSPQVAQKVAAERGVDASVLAGNVSVQLRTDGLHVTVHDSTAAAAEALAKSWAEAIVAVINGSRGEPTSMATFQRRLDGASARWRQAAQAMEATSGDISSTEQRLRLAEEALADGQRDLTSLEQATEVVRRAVASGAPSLAQLRAALANLAIPAEVVTTLPNAQEMLAALETRRQIMTLSVEQLSRKVDDLRKERQKLLPLSFEADAARANYQDALRVLQSAELAPLTARVAEPASAASATGRDWLQRLGAAAAVGLVVGIVGAFGLEMFPSLRRWLKSGGGG